MTDEKPTKGRIIVVLFAILVFVIGAGAGSFQAVLNSFNLYFYSDDWTLRYVWAPVGLTSGIILAFVLHELGHAVAARALSCPVDNIQIGTGSKVATFRFAGFLWTIHQMPIMGLVHYGPPSLDRAILKMFLVIAAGPVVSILLAGISALATYALLRDQALNSNHPVMLALLVGWTIGCAFVLPGSLFPTYFKIGDRVIPTDMQILWDILRMKDRTVVSFVQMKRLQQEIGTGVVSADSALAWAAQQPDPKVLLFAVQTLRGYKDSRAIDVARKLLDVPTANPKERMAHVDTFLTTALDQGEVRRFADANNLADELISLAPDDPSVQGTRGSILVDLGRLEEGRIVLQETLQRVDTEWDRAYCQIFLALVAEQKGETEEAHKQAQQAAKLAPDHAALGRISHLLGSPTANKLSSPSIPFGETNA